MSSANSGSYAKETGVRGISDVDVFISLKSDTSDTLKELYEKLLSLAQTNGWSPRRQNVSVGVTVNGTRGDLVPGKLQAGQQNYHSLYLRRRDSWTQTNVTLHVDTVHRSGRLKEIRAVKIWRMLGISSMDGLRMGSVSVGVRGVNCRRPPSIRLKFHPRAGIAQDRATASRLTLPALTSAIDDERGRPKDGPGPYILPSLLLAARASRGARGPTSTAQSPRGTWRRRPRSAPVGA